MAERIKDITVNISEMQTIIELSQCLQPFNAEVYVKKLVQGGVYEANIKSLLGLINLQLANGDRITVRSEGSDAEGALVEVINYLT